MEPRQNKPRIFLSHSKADKAFIHRVKDDLEICQIASWLDEYEIRHGRPWLDAIFEDGIPVCDAVVVYLTANSIESAMVKKEMDAALVQQLQDKHVAFLPYVEQAALRAQLRTDIRALQVHEWNEENYSAFLPQVVAEIWRSFLERTVASTVADERVRRLEAEKALDQLRGDLSDTVFSKAEEVEFTHIWDALDRFVSITVAEHAQRPSEPIGQLLQWKVELRLNTLVPLLVQHNYSFDYPSMRHYLQTPVNDLLASQRTHGTTLSITTEERVASELLMFGLLDRIVTPREADSSRYMSAFGTTIKDNLVWSAKSQRLLYWLEYHGRPSSLQFGDVQTL